jgi:hypothetical protein
VRGKSIYPHLPIARRIATEIAENTFPGDKSAALALLVTVPAIAEILFRHYGPPRPFMGLPPGLAGKRPTHVIMDELADSLLDKVVDDLAEELEQHGLHRGGPVGSVPRGGLRPDEVPAILSHGEVRIDLGSEPTQAEREAIEATWGKEPRLITVTVTNERGEQEPSHPVVEKWIDAAVAGRCTHSEVTCKGSFDGVADPVSSSDSSSSGGYSGGE